MAQDYVRPPFGEDGEVTLARDVAYLQAQSPLRLWAQWRNISPKNVTVTFLLIAPEVVEGPSPEGEGPRPEVEGPRPEVVDVSNRVARLVGTRVDTNGGARIRLVNGDPLETIARAVIELSKVVFGRPDAVEVSLLEPERVT